MSDYTPTTAAIRGRIIQRGGGWGFYGLSEFDAWLAAHDAEKRAEWEARLREAEAEMDRRIERYKRANPKRAVTKLREAEAVIEAVRDYADDAVHVKGIQTRLRQILSRYKTTKTEGES